MAAQWDRLRDYLRGQGDAVTLTWNQLDDIVGGLPASATDHAAFWSGDRPHSRAWRAAGFERGRVERGRRVTFHRLGTTPAVPARTPIPTARVQEADVLLVTCVKEKLDRPAAARNLYTSALFQKERAYAENRGVAWFILSAEHGLVAPDEWLAPYDRYLPDTPAVFRAAWAGWVIARLILLAGELDGRTVEVHASEAYVDVLRDPLRAAGAVLVEPLRGLRHGERLAWYDARSAARGTDHQASLARVIGHLESDETALTPAVFRERARLDTSVPGLYSWWVDEDGAAELTRGLGHRVLPGLIYAGLAGAARAGTAPSSTLWSRINGNHLGGRRTSSTFRQTLGAVLDAARGEPVDRLALTAWINTHLRVVTHPHADPFTLGALETDVLTALDPPLNLDKVQASALRRRLSALRRNALDPERTPGS